MAIGTEGDSTTAQDGPSLADDIGAMFGDMIPVASESPELDAGSPPADALPTPDGSEGAEPAAELAGSPPADAAAATPDQAAPNPTDDDWKKDATPLTYTVDGQARAFDGIQVLKDADGKPLGGIVAPESIAEIEQRLADRDHLIEQRQAQYEKAQEWERLTTWKDRDAQGNERTLTGPQAVEESRVVNVRNATVLETVLTALNDATSFDGLVDLIQDPATGKISVVRNQAAFDRLMKDAHVSARERGMEVRANFAKSAAPQPAPEASVQDSAMPTVEATIASANVTGLTVEEKAFLADQLPNYVRPTTPQERQQYGTTRIVDAKFTALVKTLGARAAQTASVATAASTASRDNAARLAAAAIGKRPVTPTRTPTPTPKVDERQQANDDAWDMQEKAAAAAIRRRSA